MIKEAGTDGGPLIGITVIKVGTGKIETNLAKSKLSIY